MKGLFVRSAFNYDMDKVSQETGLECKDPSLTQQQFKDETEIRTIVERFGLTGQLPENPRVPTYGDFTGVDDYQSALNAVKLADLAFLEFPAAIRARFDHDPQQLLEFVADDANYAEAVSLGLVKKPVVVDPPPVVMPAEVIKTP